MVGQQFLRWVAAPGSVELCSSAGEDGLLEIADPLRRRQCYLHLVEIETVPHTEFGSVGHAAQEEATDLVMMDRDLDPAVNRE